MRNARFSNASQKLINKFIEEGRVEAFDLVKALLEITPHPDVNKPKEEGYSPRLEPRTRLDEWQYSRFLKEDFKRLVALDASRALDLATGLLCDFVRFSYPENEKEGNYEDISQVWRSAVENHSQNHQYEQIEDSLVTAVRDTALGIIKTDPKSLRKVVSHLESYKWVVFRRISIYLLSEYPTQATEIVSEHLLNKELFSNSDFRHEYYLLAQKGFGVLNAEQQETILQWVEEAKQMTEAIEGDKLQGKLSDEKASQFLEVWRRDRFSQFADYLTGTWKKRYEDLVAKHGDPEHPDFSSYTTSFTGPTSVSNAQGLIDMGSEKMIEFLKAWKPTKDRFDFGPTREGLGREISVAIKLQPKYFEPLVERFKELDPTYVRSYLDGFYNLAQHDVPVDWLGLLSLCAWVVNQPRAISGRQGGVMDQDPDWGWTRRTVGSLISRGLSTSTIPFELRRSVWDVIEPLTNDPSPSPEEERTKDGELVDDAYTLSINTPRGEAMNAVIEYALWVYRGIEKTEGGKQKLQTGFAVMPEVRTVLEKHLDPAIDSSIAVRAVYGRFFPWILLMDKSWTVTYLDSIFSRGQFNNPLYLAAWQAYIIYTGAYDEPLKVLKDRYREAIQNIGKGRKVRHANEDEKLIQHLMVFYWRNKLTLSDDLSLEFWNTVDSKSRQFALDYIGRSLLSDKVVLEPEVQDQLKKLWDQRLATAQAATDKTPYAGEMSAFGWWFASNKFDERWSCEQYLKALEIADPRSNTDHFVSERLSETVKTFPVEAIKILGKLVLGDRRAWLVFGNKEKVNSIILTALQSPEKVAQNEARDLLNRLVANGHVEFRNLLTRKDPAIS